MHHAGGDARGPGTKNWYQRNSKRKRLFWPFLSGITACLAVTPCIILKWEKHGVTKILLEANVVYLDEELKNNREHLERMAQFLKENPSISIYKRKIRDHLYYYKKYWKDGKSVSDFLCKEEADYQERLKEIMALNEKRRTIKIQLKKLQQVTNALEKQLRMARRAYEYV